MAGKTLRVMATFLIKPDAVNAFKALISRVREPTRAEPGCLSYHLLQNEDDRTCFVFNEEWRCEDDLADHLATPHVLAIADQLQTMLVSPPTVDRYVAI